MPVPKGLTKCPVCGEYRGKVSGRDLTIDVEDLDLNYYLDRVEYELRMSYRDDAYTVSCLCDGIPCPRCHKNKIHRPISNSYNEKANTVEHWPYFSGQIPCGECRSKK